MQDQDKLTSLFYDLISKLWAIERFAATLERLEVVNEEQIKAIYHSSHSKYQEQMRNT